MKFINDKLAENAYYLKSDAEQGTDLHRLLSSMYSGYYDMLILIGKKGHNLIGAFEKGGLFPEVKKRDVFTCSDKLLKSPEFVRKLRDKRRICVFDDSVRYGRTLNKVTSEIRKIASNNDIMDFSLDAKVIATHKEFNVNTLISKINSFEYAFKADSINDLQYFTNKVLKTIYFYEYGYCIGAPKAEIANNKKDNIKSTECNKRFTDYKLSEVKDKNIVGFFENIGFTLWDRFLGKDELIESFGEAMGTFIANTNVEVYTHNEKVSQVISRAALSRLSEENLDYVIGTIIERYYKEGCDIKWNDIKLATPELKYEIVNYLLSVLTAYKILGESEYIFDTEVMKQHYGSVASAVINNANKAMRDRLNEEIDFFKIEVFGEISQRNNDNDDTEIGDKKSLDAYVKLLEDTLEKYGSDININDFLHIHSHMDYRRNEEIVADTVTIPMNVFLHYFKDKRRYKRDSESETAKEIRRDLVYAQITGKVAITSSCVELNEKINIIKTGKTGESINPTADRTFFEEIAEKNNKTPEGLYHLFEKSYKNTEEQREQSTKAALKSMRVKLLEAKNEYNYNNMRLDLIETWGFSDNNKASELKNLRTDELIFLYGLFCKRNKSWSKCDNNLPHNEKYEDFEIKLGSDATLYVRLSMETTKTPEGRIKFLSAEGDRYAEIYFGGNSSENYNKFKNSFFN